MSDKIYDERPWGNYKVLNREPGHWIKRIEVKPGQRLSLQYHRDRSEEWIIIQGNGEVTVKNKKWIVHAGSHIHIGVKTPHRISNGGILTNLIFIEVAIGTDLREDDIIRIQDDYGREKNI